MKNKLIPLMLICLVVFIGCNRQKSDETITDPRKKYGIVTSSEERKDSIVNLATIVYDKAIKTEYNKQFIDELGMLCNMLENSVPREGDLEFRVLERYMAFSLAPAILMTYYPKSKRYKEISDNVSRLSAIPYYWTVSFFEDDSLHMEQEIFPMSDDFMDKVILLGITWKNNLKNNPPIFSVNLPETMRNADSFRIDFVNMEDMNEDDTPNFTNELHIGDALDGENGVIPMYLFPLDLFLDKVENANAFIISYDDVSIMHSLYVFKEYYYDDLKDFMKIYKEKHK